MAPRGTSLLKGRGGGHGRGSGAKRKGGAEQPGPEGGETGAGSGRGKRTSTTAGAPHGKRTKCPSARGRLLACRMCGDVERPMHVENEETLAACQRCWSFVQQSLPEHDFFDVCDEKDNDEAFANELDQGRGVHAEDVQAGGSTLGMLCRSPLFVMEDNEIGYYVKESMELMTHAQVVAEYRRTPKSLRMRAFKLRKYNLTKSSMKEFEYLYPVRRDGSKKKLVIFTKASASSSKAALQPSANYFPGQVDKNLRQLHNRLSQENGTNSLFRLPTQSELQERAGRAHTAATEQADVGSEASADEGEQSDEGSEGSERSDVGDGSDPEVVAPRPPPVAKKFCTPTKPSKGAPPQSMRSIGSPAPSVSSRSLRSPVPSTAGQEPQKGTPDYWIFKSPPETAMLGEPQGHPRNQMNALLRKDNLDGTSRRKIGLWEHQEEDERIMKIEILEKAITTWPPQVGMHLLHVRAKDLLEIASNSDTQLQAKAKLEEVISALLPFGPPGEKQFSAKRPMLMDLDIPTTDKVDMFTTTLFSDHFASWVEDGMTKKDILLTFCEVAESMWKLGDEDEIDEALAYVLKEAKVIVQMFRFLAKPAISSSTAPVVWHSLHLLVDQAHQTKNPGMTAMCAIAASKSSWGETLRKIKPKLTLLKDEAPELLKNLQEVGQQLPTSCETAFRLTKLAERANYLQSALYEGVADNLEHSVIKHATSMAKQLSEASSEQLAAQGIQDNKADLLQAYSALFARLVTLFPLSEDCSSWSSVIRQELAGLDAEERHKTLEAALEAFNIKDSASWPMLLEALLNLGTISKLPENLQLSSMGTFMGIAEAFKDRSPDLAADLVPLMSKLLPPLPTGCQVYGKTMQALVEAMESMRNDRKCLVSFTTDPDQFIETPDFVVSTDRLIRSVTAVLNLTTKPVSPEMKPIVEQWRNEAQAAKADFTAIGEHLGKKRQEKLKKDISDFGARLDRNPFNIGLRTVGEELDWAKFNSAMGEAHKEFDETATMTELFALEEVGLVILISKGATFPARSPREIRARIPTFGFEFGRGRTHVHPHSPPLCPLVLRHASSGFLRVHRHAVQVLLAPGPGARGFVQLVAQGRTEARGVRHDHAQLEGPCDELRRRQAHDCHEEGAIDDPEVQVGAQGHARRPPRPIPERIVHGQLSRPA